MEVRDIRIEPSPRAAGWTRLSAVVHYDTGRLTAEEYWFETSRGDAEQLSTNGNPWLACLLPLAVTTGESLRVPAAVDRCLLENADRLQRIWQAWYPSLALVPVEASSSGNNAPPRSERKTAAFFSGGVDSFFTALRSRATAAPAERAPIEDLVTVWGFDVPLARRDAFERIIARNDRTAADAGLHVVDVATNLRYTRWRAAQWSYLAHGAAMAAIGLAFEPRWQRVYIAGGGGYRGLHPWGSHSVTDPLFSAERMAVVYDAVSWLRTEKIAWLAASGESLAGLRVCYESWSDRNCGRCNKCLRTMLVLEVCGALRECSAFPERTIDMRGIARMDCSHFADFREFQDIRVLALQRRRMDAVAAIDRSMARSRGRSRWVAGAAAIRRLVTARPADTTPVRRMVDADEVDSPPS